MYRILFHGPDRVALARLRADFPKEMSISVGMDRDRIRLLVEETKPHGVVLALRDPGPEDLNYLKRLVSLPDLPGIVVIADSMTPSQAVGCVRTGAYDCIVGPVSGEIVGACFRRMFTSRKESTVRSLLGGSPTIRDVLDAVDRYADQPHPILITGETGSGKSLVARIVHQTGPRRSGPFIPVNCASFPDDLFGSELFGSKRGAFTGSVDRRGLFEAADGGSLFLDEVGELSPRGQASLLRVVEDGCFRRIGSNQTRRSDVRIIAATNRDLGESMRTGVFRSDLFYRLCLLDILVPPLRKRREDIPELVRDYLNSLDGGGRWRIDGSALAKLVRYSWPGNVRELQSVVLRASLRSRDRILRARDLRFNGPHYSRTR